MQITCPRLSTTCAYVSMYATCQKIVKIRNTAKVILELPLIFGTFYGSWSLCSVNSMVSFTYKLYS